MHWNKRSDLTDGYQWRCPRSGCRKKLTMAVTRVFFRDLAYDSKHGSSSCACGLLTLARFAVALSAPGVGVIGHVPREFSRVVRHFLLHGGTLTCKVSGRRQRGKGLEVPCLRYAAVDRYRYRAIFFDQKHMRLTSSTKDRKKRCAYDPGCASKPDSTVYLVPL